MLKFSAVDLYYGVWIAIKNFCRCFNDTRFSGTGWSEEKHGADRSVGRVHSSQKDLVQTAHASDRTFLTNDARSKPLFEVLSARALLIWIEENRTHIVH